MGINRKVESLIANIVSTYGIRGNVLMYGVQNMMGRWPNPYKFFYSLNFDCVDSLDVSSQESPTYTLDLNIPIPQELYNRYDFVYDGGTMEHCFNVPSVLFNTIKLLKKDGVVLHVNPMNNWLKHSFYQFSPTLYYDFYFDNGFFNMCSWVYERFSGKDNGRIFAFKRASKLKSNNKCLFIFFGQKKFECDFIYPSQEKYNLNKRNWPSRNIDNFGGKI